MDGYLAALTGRLREVLGDSLEGVVVGGSVALGAYEEGRSDVDVLVLVDGGLPEERARELAAAVSEDALPCPARRLELVVYSERGRVVELNTGPEGLGAARHWFVVDRSIARARGRSLAGPPPRELLEEPARAEVLDALRESLAWHADHEPRSPDSVLNACRAWRWGRTGRWTSKRAAAEWARGRMSDPAAVGAALAARDAGQEMDPAVVAGFLEAAGATLAAVRS